MLHINYNLQEMLTQRHSPASIVDDDDDDDDCCMQQKAYWNKLDMSCIQHYIQNRPLFRAKENNLKAARLACFVSASPQGLQRGGGQFCHRVPHSASDLR